MTRTDYTLPLPLAESIEDAILFGHVREVDNMLKLVELDEDFPEELRYGLEALRHFRAYYGKDGDMEPTTHTARQKTMLMENAWGAELLDRIKRVKENNVTPIARFN